MGYEAGKIYKIVGSGLTYYGSTKDTLEVRLGNHKCYNNKCSSKQIIDLGDYEMILIELYPCNSRLELETREGYYIKNNECINKVIAGRTKKDYYNNNINKIIEKRKQYYIDNKIKYQNKHKNDYIPIKKNNEWIQYNTIIANKLEEKRLHYQANNL